MNSAPKADLVSILMPGINVSTELPVHGMRTCVLVDGHALTQTLWKSRGCQTFGDNAEVVICNVTLILGMRVDTVLGRYMLEASVKTDAPK